MRVLTRTSEMGLKPLHLGKRALCNKNVKEMIRLPLETKFETVETAL